MIQVAITVPGATDILIGDLRRPLPVSTLDSYEIGSTCWTGGTRSSKNVQSKEALSGSTLNSEDDVVEGKRWLIATCYKTQPIRLYFPRTYHLGLALLRRPGSAID